MTDLSPTYNQQNDETIDWEALKIEIDLYREKVLKECEKALNDYPEHRARIERLVSQLNAGKIPICSVARMLLILTDYRANL